MKLLGTERMGVTDPEKQERVCQETRLTQAEWKREVGTGLTHPVGARKGSGREVRTKRAREF